MQRVPGFGLPAIQARYQHIRGNQFFSCSNVFYRLASTMLTTFMGVSQGKVWDLRPYCKLAAHTHYTCDTS